MVPVNLLPPPGTYSFTPGTPPLVAPGGEPLAQLAHVPGSLGPFIGTALPPFAPQPRKAPTNVLPREEQISYRIVGLVQYRGDEGEIIVETVAPSPAALRRELWSGSPAGTLPNGTPLYALGANHLPWRIGDLIVDLLDVGNTMPPERLRVLAAGVVLAEG